MLLKFSFLLSPFSLNTQSFAKQVPLMSAEAAAHVTWVGLTNFAQFKFVPDVEMQVDFLNGKQVVAVGGSVAPVAVWILAAGIVSAPTTTSAAAVNTTPSFVWMTIPEV